MSVRSRPPGAIDGRARAQQLFDRLSKYDPSKSLVHVSRAQRFSTMPTALPLLPGKMKDVAQSGTGDETRGLDAIEYNPGDEGLTATQKELKNIVGGGGDCFGGTMLGDQPWVQGTGSGAAAWMQQLNTQLVFLEDRLAEAFKTQVMWIAIDSRVKMEEDSVRAFQMYEAAVEAEKGQWREFQDESGSSYYYNEREQKSAWEKPIVDEALLEANDKFQNAYKAFIGLYDRMIQAKAKLEALQKRNDDLDERVDFFVTLFKYVAFCAAFRSTRMSLLEKAKTIIDEYNAEPVRMGGDNYGYFDLDLTRASMEECIRSHVTKKTLDDKIGEIEKRRDEWNTTLEKERGLLLEASNAHKEADKALKAAASALSGSQKSHDKTRGNVDKVERDREQMLQRQEQNLSKLDESLSKARADNEVARQTLSDDMAKHQKAVQDEQTARGELENAKEVVEALSKHMRDFK